MKLIRYIVLGTLLVFISCEGPPATTNNVNNEPSPEFEVEENSDPRELWQKPEMVLNIIGDLSDKTIADIGAGTGYFAFRLLNKAKKVIAIDIDPQLIDLMNGLVKSFPPSSVEKFEARLALPDDPKLKDNEVDNILIVNTISYIEDRVSYLANLEKSIKTGGSLFIIDYKMKRMPIEAPPYSERTYLHIIEEQLDSAGYKTIYSDDTSLEYQYIVKATK